MVPSFDVSNLTLEQSADLVAMHAVIGAGIQKQAMGNIGTGALIGGGLGLGTGLLSSAMSPEKRKYWLRNALLGGAMGAGAGAALGGIGQMAEGLQQPSQPADFKAKVEAERARLAEKAKPPAIMNDPVIDFANKTMAAGKKQLGSWFGGNKPQASPQPAADGPADAADPINTRLIDSQGNLTPYGREQNTELGANVPDSPEVSPTQMFGELADQYSSQPGVVGAGGVVGGTLGNLYDRARAGQFQSPLQQARGLNTAKDMPNLSPEAQQNVKAIQDAFMRGGKQSLGLPYPTGMRDTRIPLPGGQDPLPAGTFKPGDLMASPVGGPAPHSPQMPQPSARPAGMQGPPIPTDWKWPSRNSVVVPGQAPVSVSPQLRTELGDRTKFPKPIGWKNTGVGGGTVAGTLFGAAVSPLMRRLLGSPGVSNTP